MRLTQPYGRTLCRRFIAVPALLLAMIGTAGCESFLDPSPATVPIIPQPENIEIPAALETRYTEDAARLALRHVNETDGAASDDVELSPSLVSTFYNALVHVYGMDHPARDSVVDLYRIHTFPAPATHELIVGVDPARGWVRQWRNGQRLTGNERIDALMEKFDLDLERYYSWSSGHAAVLRSAEPLNIAALAHRFSGIRGVRYAEPNGFGGDGNDIRAQVVDSGIRLDYSIGFGDCPAGCTGRHTWSFVVDTNGRTTYLGSSGGPAPEPRVEE